MSISHDKAKRSQERHCEMTAHGLKSQVKQEEETEMTREEALAEARRMIAKWMDKYPLSFEDYEKIKSLCDRLSIPLEIIAGDIRMEMNKAMKEVN